MKFTITHKTDSEEEYDAINGETYKKLEED